jgi:hypothetical protein
MGNKAQVHNCGMVYPLKHILRQQLFKYSNTNIILIKADPPNLYGYGIMKKFIERGENAGIGHSGRDLGYSANMFYFSNKNVSHIFLINYGSDGNSKLRAVFKQFQEELLNLTLN